MGSWLDGWARFQPSKTAISFQGRDISYASLALRIRQFAHCFSHDLGISRGARVGFLGYAHPDFLVALFACARLGAMLVPFNWRLTVAEHAFIVGNADLSTLLVTSDFRDHAEGLRARFGHVKFVAVDFQAPGWIPLEDALAGDGDHADRNVSYDDPILIVYTSGTTGHPKGAVLTQNAVLWNAINSTHAHDLTSDDHVLTVIPIFHVGGLNIQTTPALHAGATVTLHPRFDADAALRTISTARPTLMVLVPATAQAMIGNPLWATTDLSSLRLISMGSTVIPAPIINAFHARGVPVGQIYGATETCPIAIYLRKEDCRRIGSTGKPAIHCEVKALNKDGAETAVDERGEILVKGPNVLSGYWRDEAATSEALQHGWFRTGDIGYRDAEGFWYIVDRSKDVIISGSENIYPAELEAVLNGCEGVQECAVVSRPDARWGEVPIAVVVRRKEFALSRDDVLALFQDSIARFKHPRDVVFVEALPRNAMGKILKNKLRDELRAGAL